MIEPENQTKMEQWRKSPEASQWLKAMLSTDAGRLLLEVLKERHPLSTRCNINPGILTASGPAISGLMLGYEQCLAALRDCADAAKPITQLVSSSFGVLKAEDATE